jgi:DNA repair protein RecO (recombination protein O)
MAGPVKTEAVVLRSMRYGEADRIMQLYTPHRGRVSAIAKGVRRARSRFGGRLEPFFRLRLDLHEGRGELLTVTGAHTIDGHPRLREDARALDAAARACDAVGRLFETDEPHPGVFNLLCRQLSLLDEQAVSAASARATDTPVVSGRAGALAFRLKLLLAAGLAPQLAACACCGEHEHLVGFSGASGGVVCGACEAASFPLGEQAYQFMTDALGRPLAEAPGAAEQALGQVERAISETLEHHAHVRLMPAAGSPGPMGRTGDRTLRARVERPDGVERLGGALPVS